MFAIDLDYTSKEPVYEQIYKYIRDEIKQGNIPCGMKLPSSRGLAKYLMVSRNTIDMAYGQLQSEGYIESQEKKGYFVCQIGELINLPEVKIEEAKEKTRTQVEYQVDFSPSGVDMRAFPYNRWRKLMKECMIDDNSQLFQSGNHQGDDSLRQVIRSYLHQSRGVVCDEEQIIIGAGSDYLLLLLSRILTGSRRIGIENPTYIQAYHIFNGLGYEIAPISLDAHGMNIEELRASGADIAYVTPSHQFPMGTVMPITRRMHLLGWANEAADRYIIEDDYDSEFRYLGRPIPALQSHDNNGKVIYMGTLSKAIAPAIRVGYMVLPKTLLEAYEKNAQFYLSTVSRIDQNVLARFIGEGHFERHLNKMRGIYKNKHDTLVALLKKSHISANIVGESAGLHLLLEFKQGTCEKELVELAKEKGVRVYPLSDYQIKGHGKGATTVILGYARLEEAEIEKGVSLLEEAWSKL